MQFHSRLDFIGISFSSFSFALRAAEIRIGLNMGHPVKIGERTAHRVKVAIRSPLWRPLEAATAPCGRGDATTPAPVREGLRGAYTAFQGYACRCSACCEATGATLTACEGSGGIRTPP